MKETDFRLLPQCKQDYVDYVYSQVYDYPKSEASDHVFCDLERMFYLRINKDIAVDLAIQNLHHDLEYLLPYMDT